MTFQGAEYTYVVAYDASIGFLPRYVRLMMHDRSNDLGMIEEMYLVDARRCSYGGYVPCEWIQLSFDIEGFGAKYRDVKPGSVLEPPNSEVSIGWFRAEQFDDLLAEPAVQNDEGFTHLSSGGGTVAVPGRAKTLTLTEMRRALGLKVYTAPPVSRIDSIEAHEFDGTSNSSLKVWIGCLLLILLGCGFLFVGYRRYRSVRMLLLFGTVVVLGCAQPLPALQTTLTPAVIAYDWQADDAPASFTLSIRNTGNCVLEIKEMKTGCSCALADSSAFPITLVPKDPCDVEIHIQRTSRYSKQSLVWTFLTDLGEIRCTNSFLMFPKAKISPKHQFAPALYPGDPHAFMVVAHEVTADGIPFPTAELKVPDGLDVAEGESQSGVGPSEGFVFRERTFIVSVVDQDLGHHKREVVLVSGDEKLAVAFVGWKRIPLVSTLPEKVYLAERPIRVFLTSKDETAEITRVLSAPAGIDAILASPREILVRPKPEIHESVDGEIVVETDAAASSVIRIPVVRYLAPPAGLGTSNVESDDPTHIP
jgi:hypothetical protein